MAVTPAIDNTIGIIQDRLDCMPATKSAVESIVEYSPPIIGPPLGGGGGDGGTQFGGTPVYVGGHIEEGHSKIRIP